MNWRKFSLGLAIPVAILVFGFGMAIGVWSLMHQGHQTWMG